MKAIIDRLLAALRRFACELCGSYWHTKHHHCPKHPNHVGLMDCPACAYEIEQEYDRRVEATERRRLDALADKIVARLREGRRIIGERVVSEPGAVIRVTEYTLSDETRREPADANPASSGCEWCPDHDRPAWDTDVHTLTTPATVIVGRDPDWRLCASCAELPHFRRYATRRPVVVGVDARKEPG